MQTNKLNVFNFQKLDVVAVMEMITEYVGSTLGPNGNYIVVGNNKYTTTTKDGVSVLRLVASDSPHINNLLMWYNLFY